MFAIAALAGCSQNEDAPDNPVVGGKEAKVTLKLKGDGAATRTIGAVPNESDEKAIDNLSVFIFNQTSGSLVTSAHFVKATVNGGVVSIDTKTDGNKVVVIANAAVDKAAFDALFSGVSSLATLRTIQMDLLNTHATDAGQRTIKQTSGKVLQNGWANVKYGSGDQSGVGTATVHMRFVGARIVVNAISWDGVNSGTFEPDPALFDGENSTANFTIRGIYLMDANASTRLIPALAGNTADSPENSGAADVANDYVVLDTRKFGCFEDITADPWNKEGASHPQILSDDLGVAYAAANKPIVTDGTGTAKSISTPAWWYVFGNPAGISQRPTALVVKVGWLKGVKGQVYPGQTEADKLTKNETENRYFTVYFDGVDKEQLQCGKSYGVTLKLNGNFMPASGTGGGTGGGGSTDPGKPSVDASVEVTVNTSVWRTLDFAKEWK